MGTQQRDLETLLRKVEHIDERIGDGRKVVLIPRWKKVVYTLGLTFLSASAMRYWIGKFEHHPPPPPVYVVLPCAETNTLVQEPLQGYAQAAYGPSAREAPPPSPKGREQTETFIKGH